MIKLKVAKMMADIVYRMAEKVLMKLLHGMNINRKYQEKLKKRNSCKLDFRKGPLNSMVEEKKANG